MSSTHVETYKYYYIHLQNLLYALILKNKYHLLLRLESHEKTPSFVYTFIFRYNHPRTGVLYLRKRTVHDLLAPYIYKYIRHFFSPRV